MNKRYLYSLLLSFNLCLAATGANGLNYYFKTAAANWNEAIPVGNGRLGGMVFGGVSQEKIQTNDDTFWSGEPRDYQKSGAYQYLPAIRQMLASGNETGAQTEIDNKLLGPYNESYMPLADIILNMTQTGTATDYRRELDLARGVVVVSYNQNGVKYKREIFASYPDQAIVIRITADKSNAIGLTAQLSSLVNSVSKADSNQVVINGNAPQRVEPNYTGIKTYTYTAGHGTRFQGRLLFHETDGTITTSGSVLTLKNASYVTISFVAATSFNGFDKDPYANGKDEKALCQQYKNNVVGKSYDALYSNHVSDYQSLFSRVNLDLGVGTEDNLPINDRIAKYSAAKDPSLTSLYYQFGRYLLISSSRPGSQPANLQGIWNNQMQPGWSANWTLNCNAEINYWPAEAANLSECHLPLFQMTREATIDGAKTAKNLYNSRGWMAHHNLDLWRTTWPVGGTGKWSIYQVGGAWLCQHIWDHFQFTHDKAFLESNFDILHEACLFYIDNMQKDANGYWVTSPSVSFENVYKKSDGTTGWACMGPSQDMQIIRALFKNTMVSIDILGKDSLLKKEIKVVYDKLAPMKISPTTGRLQEWNDDWEPQVPGNGQIAQGWGLVESDLITLHGTPDLAKAFRKTIEYRKPGLAENSGSWTGAFASNFWCRLGAGDSAQQVVDRHFTKAMYPNFTCQFHGCWQIDGNLGITSAINEMLLQSNAGEIALLPALPSKYPTGSVSGLRARGGYVVDLNWNYGKVTSAQIHAVADSGICKVYCPGIQLANVVDDAGNQVNVIKSAYNQISFNSVKGNSYSITFPTQLITPVVRINNGQEQNLSSISLKTGDTLSIVPKTSLTSVVWNWSGPKFSSTAKDMLLNKMNNTQSGLYSLTCIQATDTTVFRFYVVVSSRLVDSINTVPTGDYYIKKKGTAFYWTNTATTTTTSGGAPAFMSKGGGTLSNAQLWTLTKDNGYYKIVSKADGRYVNEGGSFGTNTYSNNWNTYNLYHDSIYTAVQITQNAATNKGGAFFWNLSTSNAIQYSTNSVLDESKDFAFEFILKPQEVTKTKLNILPVGDYYIRKKGTQLYWTNTATTTTTSGGIPAFLSQGSGTLANAQVWTFSKENNYYKIVSKADGRYLHEGGAFGTNTYYAAWNTYNIYSDSIYNAVQITQSGASNKGGTFFWNLTTSNVVSLSTNIAIIDSENLAFEFVPVSVTNIMDVANLYCKMWATQNILHIKCMEATDVTVLSQNGTEIKRQKVMGDGFFVLQAGIYIVKFANNAGASVKKIIIS